jgi:membrane protein YqaA with SNARE-associated domain
MAKSRPKFLESKLFYAALFLLSALLLFSPLYLKVDFNYLKSLGIFGVALFNFISASTIFFPAPGIVATGIGGALYNPLLVALASSIGSTLGESISFLFGHSGRKITHPKNHTFMESIYKIIHHKHGGWLIVLIAFIPNPVFDAVGIIAGLALYPLRKFLMLVFIGRFARDMIVAYVGSAL